jgi:LCP family protein required for cell wall assembly
MTGPTNGPPRDEPTAGSQLPPDLDPRRGGRAAGASANNGSNAPKAKKKRPLWFRITRWVAGGLAVVLLLGVATGWALLERLAHEINHINPFCNSCHRPPSGVAGDMNILLVGSDSREGLTDAQKKELHVGTAAGERSDTMILVHISRGGHAVLVSLPRDSYVKIPKHKDASGNSVPASYNKLNTAFAFGGPALTIQTVETNTGVHIDHYIGINFLGFVNVVNALGGVTICNPTAINDPVFTDSTGTRVGTGLHLPAGKSDLNGTTALEYVRAREFDPTADIGRIQRQQKFMAAMIQKAKSAGVLLNPSKLLHVVDAVAHSLTTDEGFGVSEIKTLALALRSTSPKDIDLLTVPLQPGDVMTSVGDVVKWDPTLSKELFSDFTNDTPLQPALLGKSAKVTIPPSSVSVQVLNATNTSGLAAKAAQDLAGEQFAISGTGNAPRGSDASSTVIRYGPEREDSAKTLAAAVPSATLHLDSSFGSGLQLLVGSDYDGVRPVHVASSTPTTHVRTAAQNICS